MRVCSFLPSATEILYALGLGESVAGVTFECDYPPEAASKPVVVDTIVRHGLSQEDIDRDVNQYSSHGESLYRVDVERLDAIRPDLIVTQELCDVCAVSSSHLAKALSGLSTKPAVLTLTPHTLDDVFTDIERVGLATQRDAQARELVASLRQRVERIKSRAKRQAPRVACLEWLSPPFNGGHWVPEMVTLAGGIDPLGKLGEDSYLASYGPALYGSQEYTTQALELINISAHLTDEQKLIAEYWDNGPRTELPPGHWCLFAQFVSLRDHHSVNQDAGMFFAMTNAIFDASVASWSAKRVYDSVRPITAIPYLFHGQQIEAWVLNKGTQPMDGSQWQPYQKSTFPTPPFPEFISGHSTFSAAGAEVLRSFTGSDSFGDSVTFPAGSSTTEPGLVPAQTVTLYWPTFSDAADQAGISRRYGGIHFKAGDLSGRAVGRLVGAQAWAKARSYFGTGSASQDDDDE